MNNIRKIVAGALAFVVVAAGLLVRYGAVASSVPTSGSVVNINMPAAQALNLSVSDKVQLSTGGSSDDETLGGLIHNVQESFDEGIAVGGTEVISSSRDLSVAGVTITGNVTTTSLVTDKVTSFTSSGSSQTLCSEKNTTGADRVLLRADLLYTTSTVTGGSNGFTISQSATASATGTGASVYFNNSAVSVPTDGLVAINATSTLVGTGAVPVIWRAGYYINYLLNNPTSTLSGTCRTVSH